MTKYKKIILAVGFLGLALAMPNSRAGAQSVDSLQTQINALLAQIQALQQQLAVVQSNGSAAWCHTFNANFGAGSSGDEVASLQTAISKEGFSIDQGETGISQFGESTGAAVVEFQAKYGIRQTGYVGPITRKQLNKLYGCAVPPTPTAVVNPPPICSYPTPPAGCSYAKGPNFDPATGCGMVLNCPGSTSSTPPISTSITVTSPNGGEQWTIGNTYTIKWFASGISYVNLILYKGNNCISGYLGIPVCGVVEAAQPTIPVAIAVNVPNTGSYSWTIPFIVPSGNDYRVAVQDPSNLPHIAQSNAAFTISSSVDNNSSVSPTSLSFTVLSSAINSPSPAAWQLTLTNYPDTSVAITKTYTSPLASVSDWLSVGALTGSGVTKTIMVTPQPWKVPGGLSNGIYTASIAITANNQTITVPVALTVSAPPTQQGTLSFSQSSFNFNYAQGGTVPVAQSLTFTNTSNANVYFGISVPSQPAWLNASYDITHLLTASPGSPVGIGAGVDPSGLNPGTYATNIILTGNFVGSPVTIPVTLTVTPSSVVAVQPVFTLSAGVGTGGDFVLGSTGVQLLNFGIADNSSEDLRITDLTFAFSGQGSPLSYALGPITLWQGSTQLGQAGAISTSGGVSIHLGTAVMVPHNNSVTFTLKGDVCPLQACYFSIGQTFQVYTGPIAALGAVSNMAATQNGSSAGSGIFTVIRPTTPVSLVQPYFTQNGQQTTSLTCGTSVIFNVPGYSSLWLVQTKNNQPSWNGTYSTQSAPPYMLSCDTDLGTYKNDVYAVQNGVQGAYLGSVTATVSPKLVQPYFLQNYQQTISLTCGIPEVFNVPGYSQVWLSQTKNGAQSFNGIYSVPSAPYSPDCSRDIGSYKNDVYGVVNGSQQGSFIGSVSAAIVATPAVTAPTLLVSLSPLNPPSGTVTPGSIGNTLLWFNLAAGASEDIAVTDFVFSDSVSGNAGLNNLSLYSGGNLLGVAGVPTNGQYAIHLVSPVTVPMGNSVNLVLKGDVPPIVAVNNIVGSVHTFSLISVTGVGKISNIAVKSGGVTGSALTVVSSNPSVTPVQPYFTQNGVQTTSLTCGIPEVFNVPGYSQVWLTQTKSGVQSFNGIYSVPSASYSPSCATDLGTYKNDVYTVVNGGQGQFIGTVTATIVSGGGKAAITSGSAIAFSPSDINLQQANILESMRNILESLRQLFR